MTNTPAVIEWFYNIKSTHGILSLRHLYYLHTIGSLIKKPCIPPSLSLSTTTSNPTTSSTVHVNIKSAVE